MTNATLRLDDTGSVQINASPKAMELLLEILLKVDEDDLSEEQELFMMTFSARLTLALEESKKK
jgi:hypothetical protein